MQLSNAAGAAGVAWILPNEWAPDTANEALVNDVFVFQPKGPPINFLVLHGRAPFTRDKNPLTSDVVVVVALCSVATCKAIEDIGKSAYIAVSTGF